MWIQWGEKMGSIIFRLIIHEGAGETRRRRTYESTMNHAQYSLREFESSGPDPHEFLRK